MNCALYVCKRLADVCHQTAVTFTNVCSDKLQLRKKLKQVQLPTIPHFLHQRVRMKFFNGSVTKCSSAELRNYFWCPPRELPLRELHLAVSQHSRFSLVFLFLTLSPAVLPTPPDLCHRPLHSLKTSAPLHLSDDTGPRKKNYASKCHSTWCETFPFTDILPPVSSAHPLASTVQTVVLHHFILPLVLFEGLPGNDDSSLSLSLSERFYL